MTRVGFLLLLLATSLRAERAVKLLYWHANNPSEVALARRSVDAFHAAQDRIEVEARRIPASRSSEEVLLAAILSGTTPDVCSNVSPGILPKLARAGALVDLAPLRRHLQVRAGRPLGAGFLESVAWKANPVMLFYNRTLLEELGVERPPRDYPALIALARRFKQRHPEKWVLNPSPRMTWWERFFDVLPLYLAASGGSSLLDERGRADFADEAMGEVLGLLRTGFQAGWFPRSPPVRDLFLDGEMLLRTGGPVYIPEIRRTAPEGFRFGVAPMPVPSGKGSTWELPFTFEDRKDMVVFSTTAHPDEAREFVEFLTERERDLWLLETTRQIPLRAGLDGAPTARAVFLAEPALETFYRQASRLASLDRTEHLVQIFDILSEAYEAASIFAAVTPEVALRDAGQRVDYLVENWR